MTSRNQLSRFDTVQLPSTIPCAQCKVAKQSKQYSDKRIQDLKNYIKRCREDKRAFNPQTEAFIRCSLCVGGPAPELKCNGCDKIYPRNDRVHFSKAQLKNPDEAICWTCMQERQNGDSESGGDDTSSEDSDDSEDASSSGGALLSNAPSTVPATVYKATGTTIRSMQSDQKQQKSERAATKKVERNDDVHIEESDSE